MPGRAMLGYATRELARCEHSWLGLSVHDGGAHDVNIHGVGVRGVNTHDVGVHDVGVHGVNTHSVDVHGVNIHGGGVHDVSVHDVNIHGVGLHAVGVYSVWACTAQTWLSVACKACMELKHQQRFRYKKNVKRHFSTMALY